MLFFLVFYAIILENKIKIYVIRIIGTNKVSFKKTNLIDLDKTKGLLTIFPDFYLRKNENKLEISKLFFRNFIHIEFFFDNI